MTTNATITTRLRAAGCVFAEDEADVLLATAQDDVHLEHMTRAREAGTPLEHVVGFADFCGVRVLLDPGVFIPRQRTAFLVETAAALAPANSTVLDLCCGSGALGLAFTRRRPEAEVHASDVDPRAVATARRNLTNVYEGDLFAGVPDQLRFDVVLANVPYVPTSELDLMPVDAREHEPVTTHDGGVDGLQVLRRVMAEAPRWLRTGGHVLFEVSDRQAVVGARLVYSDEHDTTVAIVSY